MARADIEPSVDGPSTETLLKVSNLQVEFKTGFGIARAVDGVDFELAAGETLGIVGESGCGKSTTALALTRLITSPPGKISSGSVVFEGKDILRLPAQAVRRLRGNRIGMIFQDPMTSLNPSLTIGRQICEPLELHKGMSRRNAMRRAAELLDHVGVSDVKRRLNEYPHKLSGGLRQRVMIATAIACNPRLLIADEPTTALDVTIQAQILDLLKGLVQESHSAIILITHDLGVVAGMTHRVSLMYAGQVVETATTVDLFENPRMPYAWGLLRAIPTLGDRQKRLEPIAGQPPDLTTRAVGCRFAPRCPHRREMCTTEMPKLAQAANATAGHLSRCWGTQVGGWLVDHNWKRNTDDPKPSTQAN